MVTRGEPVIQLTTDTVSKIASHWHAFSLSLSLSLSSSPSLSLREKRGSPTWVAITWVTNKEPQSQAH